eukprot:scaffold2125_cov126-Cylindrotheca_fusiformis.AAC.13
MPACAIWFSTAFLWTTHHPNRIAAFVVSPSDPRGGRGLHFSSSTYCTSAGRRSTTSLVRLDAAKKRTPTNEGTRKKRNRSGTTCLPRLVVFDLDGCLWKPELFELQACQDDDGISPFTINNNPKDSTIPAGTLLLSKNGKHQVELLGDTRQILYELYSEERWYPSRVGISSRTDAPAWAHELMEKFVLYPTAVNNSKLKKNKHSDMTLGCCSMKDVFDPSLCILDKTLNKAIQFQLLLDQANHHQAASIPKTKENKKLRFKDIIFFDNEAGNCKQVAELGVTCVYAPKGMTYEAWENGLRHFPSNRVLGPKLPY